MGSELLDKLFGRKREPRATPRTPSPGAGTTSVGDGGGTRTITVEPPPPPSAPATPGRLDRLFVDGVEIDSHVNDLGQVVMTKLPARRATRGKSYVTKLVVTAEPLANPADREKLRDWLSRPSAVDLLPGTHQLHVVTGAWTTPTILMSTPKIKHVGTEIQVREHASNPAQRTFGLYFYGDKPMQVEIEIPWTITQNKIPAWAWTALKFNWNPRREEPNDPERETGEQEIVIE